jgi:CheY-like chemotaxis protein
MALVVAYMDDLLFLSRIQEASRPHEVKPVRRVADILPLRPSLLVLDLDSQRLDGLAALRALREEGTLESVPVLGFFSHVHPERARAAQEAGCTGVFPRSAFLAELRKALPREA